MSKQERDCNENRGCLESHRGKEESSKLHDNTTIAHWRILDVNIL